MKIMKAAFKVLIWIAVLLLAAVLTLPVWFGPVATTLANVIVPEIVKTDFHLGHLSLNPYTARFELGDLQLANPPGYSERYATTVGDVVFDVKTFSLLTDVIHVEEIKVKDIFVSVVSSDDRDRVQNFKQIQYNVAGGREKYEASQSAKEAQAASVQDNPNSAQEEEKPPKKFIIDRLEISGLMVQLGFVPIRIPVAFVMTDIGRDRGGMTASEIGQEVWNAILKRAGVIGDHLKTLGLDVADKTTKKAEKLLDRTTSQATEALDDGVKKASDGAKKALESLKGLW